MSGEPTRTEGDSPARAGETARQLIRRAKQTSRRKFPNEEKIRILLEGMRAEAGGDRAGTALAALEATDTGRAVQHSEWL